MAGDYGRMKSLPRGAKRGKQKGPARGRRLNEPIETQPSRLVNAAADGARKQRHKAHMSHPGAGRMASELRHKLRKIAYDHDRDTPKEVR